MGKEDQDLVFLQLAPIMLYTSVALVAYLWSVSVLLGRSELILHSLSVLGSVISHGCMEFKSKLWDRYSYRCYSPLRVPDLLFSPE